ncbi:MAG: biopolymer transporter ExbD [Bacteroidia bacterium]|nr:biopolymer transporter ExbD [Bacteroidia bacterium]
MKIRKKSKFTAEVTTGPLNDIMFFLLLFFLIISTVANPNVVKLMLPKAQTTQAINKQQISLSITADKKYYINKDEIPFEQLEVKLQEVVNGMESPTVVLRPDQSLSVQDLVDVWQISIKNNIKMVLAVQK